MPRPEKVRLGEILLQQGLLTEQQLKDALDEQKKSGRKLGRVFVDKGFVSDAAKLKVDVDLVSAEEVTALVDNTVNASPAVVEKARAIMGAGTAKAK